MYYPQLTEIKTTKSVIDAFGGYNHNIKINENEFYDMKNLSSSHFPVLSTRENRAQIDKVNMPLGMLMNNNDKLCYVDGIDVIYKDKNRQIVLRDIVSDYDRIDDGSTNGLLVKSYKQIVTIGAYICIFPDNIFINPTVLESNPGNADLFGQLDAYFNFFGTVTLTPCDISANAVTATVSNAAPASPENGEYWVDTSSTPHVLKQYSETYAMWTQIATTYIKISCPGIGKDFEKDDGVLITGNLGSENKNNSHIIHAKGDDYIVISGMIDSVETIGSITVTRDIPEMDFVIESNNRLWGCKNGLHSSTGEYVNEIYACKLGDPKNWNCFQGVSTDSYIASVGSDGKFTGAVTYRKNPIFFKENHIHRVYGDRPSNFQVISDNFRGVAQGCDKSLTIVDDYLIYKSKSDICKYAGGQPVSISEALGNERYDSAVGGVYKSKYYISMKSTTDNKYNLFVYDNKFGLWSREDDLGALYFNEFNGELYCISSGRLIAMNAMPSDESLMRTYEVSNWERGSFYSGEEDEAGEPCDGDTAIRTVSLHNFGFEGKLEINTEAYFDGFNHEKTETIYHIYEYQSGVGVKRIGGDTEWKENRIIEIKPEYYYKFAARVMYMSPDEVNVWHNVTADKTIADVASRVAFTFISEQVKESDMEWYAETGTFGYRDPESKYVSRLCLRMALDINSSVSLFIQYNTDGNWEHKCTMAGHGTKSFPVSIVPRRCDHFKIKLMGKGNCKVLSLTKEFQKGSDE